MNKIYRGDLDEKKIATDVEKVVESLLYHHATMPLSKRHLRQKSDKQAASSQVVGRAVASMMIVAE